MSKVMKLKSQCFCFPLGGTEGPEKCQAGMLPVRTVQDAFCLGSKVLYLI